MRRTSLIAAIITLSLPLALSAHRLDEYLQATIFSIDAERIQGSMRLVPGVAVASSIMSGIDTNRDGVFSDAEKQAYARRVLRDLSLSADGKALNLDLTSVEFPPGEELKEGIGEIHVNFSADLPRHAANRHLVFQNHHLAAVSVYLVNTLVPSDKNIQITAQARNENQSVYEVDFGPTALAAASQRTSPTDFSGFVGAFRLGTHHIAEGTDHLLFLIVLLLPAPLIASSAISARAAGGRRVWNRRAPVRASLLHILGIVSAFTLGHSITLALSVFGLVTLPSRPVEVLIAVSILISAIHAFRPLFPGREAAVAAFFGLIHGLAFASALNALGFGGWYRLVSLLGFNLGIEAMQIVVVAAVLPSLLVSSRTRAYSVLRILGALFAAIASVGWIAERVFNIHTPLTPAVEAVAQRGAHLAAALFMVSLACWLADKWLLGPINRLNLAQPQA